MTTIQSNYAKPNAHRWIGGMTPDFLECDFDLYQPRPDYHYQTDYSYGEHFSILNSDAVHSLVQQVKNGAKFAPVCLHHFSKTDGKAVNFILDNGGMDFESRGVVQQLAFAAYNHIFQYGNNEIGMVILVKLIAMKIPQSRIRFELDYYHGNENCEAEFMEDFVAAMQIAEKRAFAEELSERLSADNHNKRRSVKI